MDAPVFALRLIEQEVVGLMGRMAMVRPFALHETMVPAAIPARDTLLQIDRHLARGRERLARLAGGFLRWLRSRAATAQDTEQIYRRYVYLRLQVNAVLTQFDLFSDAVTQRSEADTGVWLAGVDALARDALALPQAGYEVPPLLCYLDRGVGAAIRRARTRLPGGGENPVAIIRVPRERMVGLGIASSLVHEAGHQGAALIDLVPALRQAMEPMLGRAPGGPPPSGGANPWTHWSRWISEIVADLWAVGRLGVTATLGLVNVVSLPRVFVFRGNLDDPHPTPWLRVALSLEMGRQLYPHSQWDRVEALWRGSYPVRDAGTPDAAEQLRFARLLAHIPEFVRWLLQQRPASLAPRTLGSFLLDPEIVPRRLDEGLEQWSRDPALPGRLRPCRAFALVGYGRLVRGRTPQPETRLFTQLLTRWALASPEPPAPGALPRPPTVSMALTPPVPERRTP